MTYKFYDTKALIKCRDELFNNPDEYPVFTDITMNQLSNLKYSEDEDGAFELSNILREHIYEYSIWPYHSYMFLSLKAKCPMLLEAPAFSILAAAMEYDNTIHPDETVFVTTDRTLGDLANRVYFGEDSIIYV